MRLFLFLFIIFSCSVFAAGQPAKVVSVIPVKFNGKGLHAPVPYNQQMMQRGWASVPAIAVPLSGGTPRYQPVRIAKPNLIRTLSRMGYQAAKMSPAGKIALAAYGAYEANCTAQAFASLCYDAPFDQATATIQDGIPAVNSISCTPTAIHAPVTFPDETNAIQSYNSWLSGIKNFSNISCPADTPTTRYHSCTRSMDMQFTMPACGSSSPVPITRKISSSTSYSYYDSTNKEWKSGTPLQSTLTYNSTFQVREWETKPTKSCTNPNFPNGPLKFDGVDYCFPLTKNIPVDETWLDEQYQKNPTPIINSDIGLDDFVDWETGAPYPDLFDNPTFDPVSPTFAEVAESIANGTVQHTNPNAPHYVPSEMMPNLLIQINNWHEGNTFTDLYTGKTITPEAPPKEETPIDWSKFPGITKAQYEASNNAWGNQAVQGQNIQTEVDKLTQEQQKLSDFIETPLPDFAGQPKLLDFVTLPTGGGCRGFTLSVSLQGQAKSINVDQHCPPYNDWGQPVVSWLLSIYTLLLCFRIFHRTLEVS